jgi:hypothetical protein
MIGDPEKVKKGVRMDGLTRDSPSVFDELDLDYTF